MKTIHLLTCLCAATTLATAAPDLTAWQWSQPFEVTVPGMTRLELPPATHGVSQPALADLRLVSPEGVETPFLIEDMVPPRVEDQATNDFRATLGGRRSVLTANQKAGEIEAVILQTPARGFLKSATVEGSEDGNTWQPIVSGEIVFHQAGPANRLRIPLPPSSWPHLRVTLDDDRSPPVAFTGMRVTPVRAKAETIIEPAIIRSRTDEGTQTKLILDLVARNLNIEELTLDVSTEVFSRPCRVSIGSRTIELAMIYRVTGENNISAASLTIPVHERIPTDYLQLTISNGDSPPLDIRGVSTSRYPDRLLFFASKAGPWKLLTGNRHAAAPRYDLAPLRAEMTRTPGSHVSPGPMVAKPDYQAPTALPEVTPAGSEIDLTAWGRRRAVHSKLPGVISLELDAVTLAHAARSDLGDLRLIQNGQQIPWLLDANPPMRTLQPQVEEIPDPKRPKTSRWKITLPIDGLPVHNLTAESPDPLFTREIRVIQHSKDELGNPRKRLVASSTWTKSPAGGSGKQTLDIRINHTRVPDALWLETDNGDNPPIRLQDVTIGYRAPALLAKITEDAPIFLYYDNPHASPPVYDLSLVRSELLAADKQAASLGGEELLKAGSHRSERDINAGSPWLWAALAVVVVFLLFIVAKMLPKEADHQTS